MISTISRTITDIVITGVLVWCGNMQAMDRSELTTNQSTTSYERSSSRKLQQESTFSVYEVLKNAAIGCLAGTAEIVVNQPFLYFKNTLQLGNSIEWMSPKVWYRGFGMNIAAMGPTTAFQTATNGALQRFMPGIDTPTLLVQAFIAGLASAIVCGPIDLVILDQQKNNRSIPQTIRNLVEKAGWRVLFRGWSATALREGPWSAAYLAGFPIAHDAIKNQINNPLFAAVGAYILAGALTGSAVAVVTQPIDTIKTCIQNDYQGTNIKSTRDAIRSIYSIGGIKGFFSGLVPRAINCGLAVPLMGMLTMYLSKKGGELH